MFTLATFPYFDFVIASSIGVYCWETYLNFRQRSKLKEKEPSKLLVENKLTTRADYKKSQLYGLDKNSFTLFKDVINAGEQLIFISFGYLYFWTACSRLSENIYVKSLLFIIFYQIFETVISIPFGYYLHFVIEEKHGFNKQTFRVFWTDIVKQTLITVIIISIIIPAMIWIISYFGDEFVWFLWIFISSFMLLMIWLAPNVIMPCFYKFDTLNEDIHCKREETKGLKKALDALSDGLSFPLKKVFVMDGSTVCTKLSDKKNFFLVFCAGFHVTLLCCFF